MEEKKEVIEYTFIHYDDGTTRLNLYFEDDTWASFLDLKPDRALFLADLLRHEKPVFWTEGPDILWTGREPVGESEV